MISFTALFLLIWFRTEAFVEYAKLFRLSKFFKIDLYEEMKRGGAEMSYHDFLLEHFNMFGTRLITCPICVSTWLCGIFALFNPLTVALNSAVFGLLLYLILAKML